MERRGGAPERWMGREGGSRASAGAGHGAASAAAGGEERGSARSGDRGRSVVYPDERTQVTAPGTPGKTTGNRSSWRRGTVVRRFMVGSMVKRPRNFGLSRPRGLHRHFPCGPDRCSIGGVMLAALLTTGFFAATAVFARRGGCRRACGRFARAPQPSRTGAQGGGRVWPPLVPHVERRHRGAARDGRAVGAEARVVPGPAGFSPLRPAALPARARARVRRGRARAQGMASPAAWCRISSYAGTLSPRARVITPKRAVFWTKQPISSLPGPKAASSVKSVVCWVPVQPTEV